MKVAAISGAVIAALAAGAVATPSFAQPYGYASDCRHSDGTAGTIIGGIAGAVLGSNLAAHHGGRAGGAAIGGVAGALIGNSIGRSGRSCGDQGYYSRSYSTPAYSSGYYTQPTYGYVQPTYSYAQPSYGYSTYYTGGYDGRYSDYSYVERPRHDRDRDHDRGWDRERDHDHDRDGGWRGDGGWHGDDR